MQNSPFEVRRRHLLARLVRQKNGVVADAQAALGGSGSLKSYGVSLPAVRTAAAVFAPDHAFAGFLFGDRVRELKLAAAYIDDPLQVTPSRMEGWKNRFETFEVAVNCASALFWKAPDAYPTALGWLERESGPMVLRAAAIMVSKCLSAGLVPPDSETVRTLFPLLAKNMTGGDIIVTDGIAGILEWLVRKNESNRKEVEHFLEKQEAEGNPAASEMRAQAVYW